jgi:hypothetical protein
MMKLQDKNGKIGRIWETPVKKATGGFMAQIMKADIFQPGFCANFFHGIGYLVGSHAENALFPFSPGKILQNINGSGG